MLDGTPKGKELYILEYYNNKDTIYICDQLRKHALALGIGSPSIKYGLDKEQKSHRVIAVFQHESIMNAVIKRLNGNVLFSKLTNFYLLKSITDISSTSFFTAWKSLKRESKSLF